MYTHIIKKHYKPLDLQSLQSQLQSPSQNRQQTVLVRLHLKQNQNNCTFDLAS